MNAPWKTVRVFISSTFRDMQAERDWLVRFVFPLLREELLKYRIHFVDVDLRWGVTSDQDALGVCREVIDECQPLFMCVLGGRYGWVPDGNDKSITADEIHYGAVDLEAEERGHSFFYFREDSATALMEEETPGDFREPPGSNSAQKLAVLKQSITDAGFPVFIYDAKWDAAQKRLTGLEAFGKRVHADLLQSLKDDPELVSRFTDESTAPPDEFAEEAEQMEAFIEERTDRFVVGSRQPLMRDMLDFASADGAPNILVITGDPGSGKSALLGKFCRDHSALHSSSFLLPTFIGASTGSTDLRRTLRRLSHELAQAVGDTEPLPLDIKELIKHFQKLLAEAAGRRRVILVLDALNQLDATDGAHWLNWLPPMEMLPPGVRIVASVIAPAEGEQEHQTLAILRNRKDVRIEDLKPLAESDTLAIIEGYLKRYSKRLSDEQIAALTGKPASNLPLYILTALEELRTLGTYEEITDRIGELPGDACALFGWILTERLARDPGFRDREGRPCGAALVEKFAACLGVSRHGLSPTELTTLLDPGDPLGNVGALLRLLRPYLMRRGELLDFYHGQFREAARETYLDTPEKQRTAHQSVATCLQAFTDPHCDGQSRDANPHALSELPHHQIRAEAWPDLIATLENIFFLEAKVTHGMAFDLAEDFTASVEALPLEHLERQRLRLLDEALRRDLHFIARHAQDYPQALFQCLWNSCWWYDCLEAAKHYVEPKGGWLTGVKSPPWRREGPKLCKLLEQWLDERERDCSPCLWLRALRPPRIHLGSAQRSVLSKHEDAVTSVAFSPDDIHIASASHDKTVRLWDAASGRELSIFSGHESLVSSVAYSPDGQRIVSGSRDNTVRVWDVATRGELMVLRGHIGSVESVAFSPNGRLIASGGGWNDKTLRIWDSLSGTELFTLRGHEREVKSVTFSRDGFQIASGSEDKTVRIWDLESGQTATVIRKQEATVASVAFSPAGGLIAVGLGDATVRVVENGSGCREIAIFRGHEVSVNAVAFSPDGRRIVSASWDGTVRVWDVETGATLGILRGHEAPVRSVAFCSQGRHIVSGSFDRTVRIWDTATDQDQGVLDGHMRDLKSIAISPDGRQIATGSDDRTVRLWDAESGCEKMVIFHGHESQVTSVAFSPDNRRIASGSMKVRVWDAVSGHEQALLSGHGVLLSSLAFSPDGRRIATGARDKTVRVWDSETGRQLAILRAEHDEPGHELEVRSVAFSPEGKRIASGAGHGYGTIHLWDSETGRELTVLRSEGSQIDSVAFSPDGKRIASASDWWSDETVRVWDVDTGICVEIVQGRGDVRAIAAGPELFPYRALANRDETRVESVDGGKPVGFFPTSLSKIATHTCGCLWVGAVCNHLVILRLERR